MCCVDEGNRVTQADHFSWAEGRAPWRRYAMQIKPGEEIVAGSSEHYRVLEVVPFVDETDRFVRMLNVDAPEAPAAEPGSYPITRRRSCLGSRVSGLAQRSRSATAWLSQVRSGANLPPTCACQSIDALEHVAPTPSESRLFSSPRYHSSCAVAEAATSHGQSSCDRHRQPPPTSTYESPVLAERSAT